MKKITQFLLILLIVGKATQAQKDFYQILVYHFNNLDQEQKIDDFLGSTFVPQMHIAGFKSIGVFAPLANDTSVDKKIYILLQLKSLKDVASWNKSQFTSSMMQEKSPDFWNVSYDKPAFTRMESIIVEAWDMASKMQLPQLKSPKEQHIYELRSYESPSEKYYRSKVHMFNEGGEIKLFARLGFNAVFYGDVISGSRMPNLMYMTCFENMEARNAHWKDFVESPEWKKLISMKEYDHNVNRADNILMRAKAYSDY